MCISFVRQSERWDRKGTLGAVIAIKTKEVSETKCLRFKSLLFGTILRDM